MKTVTINNNWVKISDLIEKDSVILVSDGSVSVYICRE